MILRTILRCVCMLAICCVDASAKHPAEAPFPSEYRQWVHVKSALVGPKSAFFASSGGLFHLYANTLAMDGYRTGRFSPGSAIVFDLLEVGEKEGVAVEGARVRIDVMQMNNAGQWEFGRFMKGLQALRVTDAATIAQCAACHAGAKGKDHVFSEYRL